jgi:DNA-binding MarR family transcriptional regulator
MTKMRKETTIDAATRSVKGKDSGSNRQLSLAQDIGKRDDFTLPEQEAYLNLLRTADQLVGAFHQLFKTYGVTAAQYNALRILRGHETRVATRRIADEMVTREPDITRLIDRLEQAGLAKRERCREDRRVVWVTITAKGLELLHKLEQPVMTLHQQQLGHMGSRKLQTLSKLLTEARRNVS